jgi:type I restriction enzyme M protein
MNLVLHGIEDFQVVREDTLQNAAFTDSSTGGLATFDCVIANPPFSLKEWGRDLWEADPRGRAQYGIPPESYGDYAFVQHMIASMAPTGNSRMAVVLPQGALFRKSAEGSIRQALLEKDMVEAVIGLAPNLFYGTQLAGCVVILRRKKPENRKNKVLIIDASSLFRKGRAQNCLASDYKQYIFPLMFFKRLSDVWDEDYQQALDETGDEGYTTATANDRFVIPEGAHWNDVRAAPRDVGRALLSACLAIEAANPERLQGVFDNANWTDKAQMPDSTLKNLIEHVSKHDLTLAAVPEDEPGNGYEYLIKKFADDSGHTAQEFYTNRTLVHLMAQMLEPQPGERIYDPTCGTGGRLISFLAEVKRRGGDIRTTGLYGQELITITAAVARMNPVIHGVDNFHIASGNTLATPAFVPGDRLRTFDVVLANPPYSIKKWNRGAWESDPWGRNFLGTPPQGRADYAFFQHILSSMSPKTGRCAILFPHGVLFRNEEAEMRRRLVESERVECVLGLGPGLFYNSPMEACVVICRSRKPAPRQRRILFIDAGQQIARE